MNHQENYSKTTILFPVSESEITLGMKKRGFGEGFWNGFGGKLENGETYEQAAIREAREEAGIDVQDIQHVASLEFFFDNILKVVSRAYLCSSYRGEFAETEEMRPKTFSMDDIPYDSMWPADKKWIPLALNHDGEAPLAFRIYFDNSNNYISHEQISISEIKTDL